MRANSHRTVIGVIRDGVSRWRRREGLTRQLVADRIVDAHNECGFDSLTGLDFHAVTGDADRADRAMQTNSERIWRWLDDETKETTLLPANLIPSVLMAMPVDIRQEVVTEILAPLGLVVSPHISEQSGQLLDVLMSLVKEGGEANTAFARLCVGTDAASASMAALIDTDRELAEAMAALSRARDEVLRRVQSLRGDAVSLPAPMMT